MNENMLQIKADKREYGIDCVKIIAAFLVVLTHIFTFGGFLDSINDASFRGFLLNFIRAISLCAVDIFGFCTGYLCIGKRTKYSKLIQLWIQVVVISVSVIVAYVLMALITNKTINSDLHLHAAFLPLTFNTYWFFTAYFLLSLFTNYYNKLIDILNKKDFTILILISILFFVLLYNVSARDSYLVHGGYSFLWLSVCYFIGAYIRKYSVNIKAELWLVILIGVVALLIYPSFRMFYKMYPFKIFDRDFKNIINNYNSLSIFFSSLMIFLAFSKIKIKNSTTKKILIELSSASFAVYIIHITDIFRGKFIDKRFIWVAQLSTPKAVATILLSALIIFVICSIIAIIQIKVFKLIKIDKLCDKIELMIGKAFNKVYKEGKA